MKPFRIAIIGAGPAGFYTAHFLLKQKEVPVLIEMFDRLPTPFGLIRNGVAPDHPHTKRVAEFYHQIAMDPRVRFFGNVTLDKNFSRRDLLAHYHQVVYAMGAQESRPLNIPGVELQGCYTAREIVGWYNAHPDFSYHQIDFSLSPIVIIGNGNVALDIARILCQPRERLHQTDMGDHALNQLSLQSIPDIRILGRKSPFHAAFTFSALQELIALPDTSITFEPDMSEFSSSDLPLNPDQKLLLQQLQTLRLKAPARYQHRIVFQFLSEPVAITGKTHVEGLEFRRIRCSVDPKGWHYEPDAHREFLPARIVICANGYRGIPIHGLPFDESKGIIPHRNGRIIDESAKQFYTGEYVAGWIKRGPTGSLPLIRKDAEETVAAMIEDLCSGQHHHPSVKKFIPAAQWLYPLKKDFTVYEDWLLIDSIEKFRGKDHQRPRVKLATLDEMLNTLSCS